MKTLKLGSTDVEVSALCLGTDSIGSKIDRERSFQLLDLFREKGGTFVDTANFYASWVPGCQGGESETTIGLWMKQRGSRDQMVISSKLGFDYPGCGGGLTADRQDRSVSRPPRRSRHAPGRDYGGIRSPGPGGKGARHRSEQSESLAHRRGQHGRPHQWVDPILCRRAAIHLSASAPRRRFRAPDIT